MIVGSGLKGKNPVNFQDNFLINTIKQTYVLKICYNITRITYLT